MTSDVEVEAQSLAGPPSNQQATAGGGVPYTLAELDEAIREVLENYLHPSLDQKQILAAACAVAWITNRPEDQYTRILRSAYADLEKYGAFRPRESWE